MESYPHIEGDPHERAAELMAEAAQLSENGDTQTAMDKIREADILVPYPEEEGCF